MDILGCLYHPATIDISLKSRTIVPNGAILLPDQTFSRITTDMVDLFTTYEIPEIVHLDQGRNFESAIFQQVLKAFGLGRLGLLPITHKVMVWLKDSTTV